VCVQVALLVCIPAQEVRFAQFAQLVIILVQELLHVYYVWWEPSMEQVDLLPAYHVRRVSLLQAREVLFAAIVQWEHSKVPLVWIV
jgi:hypothetical protein